MKNEIIVSGQISDLKEHHESHGEQFCKFYITSTRNSGTVDTLPCIISKKLTKNFVDGMDIEVVGDIRTYNINGHLEIYVFVKEVREYITNENSLEFEGYICKKPILRETFFGKQITDLLIAVNSINKKSYYIPCIAWGRNAKYADTLNVGDKVRVTGRFQSREYTKVLDDGTTETRTAYEVSAMQIEEIWESEGE